MFCSCSNRFIWFGYHLWPFLEYGYGGHPYDFTGIFEIEPRDEESLGEDIFKYRETIVLGETDFTDNEIRQLVESIGHLFKGIHYHLLHQNCNHFCDHLAKVRVTFWPSMAYYLIATTWLFVLSFPFPVPVPLLLCWFISGFVNVITNELIDCQTYLDKLDTYVNTDFMWSGIAKLGQPVGIHFHMCTILRKVSSKRILDSDSARTGHKTPCPTRRMHASTAWQFWSKWPEQSN